MYKVAIGSILFFMALPSHANSLTHAYVQEVRSSKGGIEVISGSTNHTTVDHGGAQMYVITHDIGYGSNPSARFLGGPVREIKTEPLCGVVRALRQCRRGDTIIGYRRTWDVSGHEAGNFQYMVFPNGVGGVFRLGFQVY